MAELRTSLYSEPGLLRADARSSTFNLIIDPPDIIAQGPYVRPKSIHGGVVERPAERPKSHHFDTAAAATTVGRKRVSAAQKRRSAPALPDLSNIVLPDDDALGDKRHSSGPEMEQPSPYRHIPVSATSFMATSRHSLGDPAGYFALTAPSKRSPSASASNSAPSVSTTPGELPSTAASRSSSPLAEDPAGQPKLPAVLDKAHVARGRSVGQVSRRGEVGKRLSHEVAVKTPVPSMVEITDPRSA